MRYGIGWTTLRVWVQRYKQHGAAGLIISCRNRKYEPEIKRAAVCEYLRGGGSLNEICQKHDISDSKMLRQWIKWYNRVMRVIGMKSVIRRKKPNCIKSTPEITAENILNRNFAADKLNEKWLTDVTEFKYGDGGKLYLSAILNLKDKGIVSYVIGHSNNNRLVFDTFDTAIQKYPDVKPLFHSDRGSSTPVKFLGQSLTHRA